MQKTTAKDFFLQVAVMAALYISAVSLISLLFQIINFTYPDRVSYYFDPYGGTMRMAIASLIIVFPLFLAASYFLRKDYASFPEKHEASLRKWLVYLTLFVAAAAIATDLVVLINIFLGGEITTRFILKILSVLIVSGMIFGYYFYDLRTPATEYRHAKLFAGISTVIVVAAIMWGFATVGSPAKQRLLRFDNQKVQHLEQIQHQLVYTYYPQKGKLPASLSEVEETMLGSKLPRDPQTDSPYEFERVSNTSFKLCANFNLASLARESEARPVYEGLRDSGWSHAGGRQCFDRTIDPEIVMPKPRF